MISLDNITFTMTVPLDHLETLSGLLDGCIGTAGDDDFVSEIKPILKKIDNAIAKHKKKQRNIINKVV